MAPITLPADHPCWSVRTSRAAPRLSARQQAMLPDSLLGSVDTVPMPKPHDVIGHEDTREHIRAIGDAPWRMVCQLRIHGSVSDDVLIGTGWLAGPRTVLTVGHNLLNGDENHHAVEVMVTPGRDGSRAAALSLVSSDFDVHPRWRSNGDPAFDLGVIWLPQDYGSHLGHFRFAPLNESALLGKVLGLAGYPIDKAAAEEATTMWYDTGAVRVVEERFLGYTIDTEDGQSGAPLFAGDEHSPIVRGIHSQGRVTENFAVRITDEVAAQFNAWIR